MPIKLGNTNFGQIYLGSVEIAEAYLGSVKVYGKSAPDPYNPLGLPEYTIRAQFTEGYTPATPYGGAVQVSSSPNVWDLTYNFSNSWSQIFKNNTDLIAILGANADGDLGLVYATDSMFEGCTNLESVALFNTSEVVLMNNMFYNCSKIVSLPDFDTTRCWNFTQMFYGCSSLLACPNISTTYRSQSTTLTVNRMFELCTSLTSVPLLSLNGATSTVMMFSGCTALTSVPQFDLSTVTDAHQMFATCTSLDTVPLFNTAAVTTAYRMFQGCTALTTVPLLNTSSLVSAYQMFENCTALTEIPAFNLSAVTNANGMFHNCSSVTSGTLAAYQQLSASPVATHNADTFGGAGPAADLAQIPAGWGGTMREWQNDYYIEIIPTSLGVSVAFGGFYTNGSRQSISSAQIKDGSWISVSSSTVNSLNGSASYVYKDLMDGFRAYFTKAADLTSLQYKSTGASVNVNIKVYGKRVGSSSWTQVASKSSGQGGTITITV